MTHTKTIKIRSQRTPYDAKHEAHQEIHKKLLSDGHLFAKNWRYRMLDAVSSCVKYSLELMMKISIIMGLVSGSYMCFHVVNEMKAQQTLAAQQRVINNTLMNLKNLNNPDVDQIIGVKR